MPLQTLKDESEKKLSGLRSQHNSELFTNRTDNDDESASDSENDEVYRPLNDFYLLEDRTYGATTQTQEYTRKNKEARSVIDPKPLELTHSYVATEYQGQERPTTYQDSYTQVNEQFMSE